MDRLERTPRPWKVDVHDVLYHPALEIRGADDEPIAALDAIECPVGNGELIVRAVNSHDELLAACKAALALITDDGTQGGPEWTKKALRQALTKAVQDG